MAALRETLGSRTYAELYPRPERKRRDTDTAHPLNGTYKVFPWATNDPSEGEREVVYAPHHPLASPQGWHRIPADGADGEDEPSLWTRLPMKSDKWMYQPGWSKKTRRGMNLTDTRCVVTSRPAMRESVADEPSDLLAATTSLPRRTGKASADGRTTAGPTARTTSRSTLASTGDLATT